MKVQTSQPVSFRDSGLVPEDLNRVWLYAKDALDDVASRRFAKSTLVLPFVRDVGSAYTAALLTEERTYRFTCPVTCIVERAFLHANMTSTVEVNVVIEKTSDSSTPQGATVPWLSTLGATVFPAAVDGSPSVSEDGIIASADDDVTDINVDRVLLVAGTEYQIRVAAASGSMQLERFDVILHLLTDRWLPSSTLLLPSYSPTLLTAQDARDATVVVANNAALATEAAKLASNKLAPTPVLFVIHGLTAGTDADIRTFTLPSFDAARAQCRLKRIYLWASWSVSVTQTITATLTSSGGATLATATASVTGGTFASGDSGAIDIAMTGGSPATTTDDRTLTLAQGAGAVAAQKVYALLWLSR